MATLLEHATFSEIVYQKDNSPPVPAGWQLISNSNDPTISIAHPAFYAETYINHTTGEILTTFRGTASGGDVFPEWIQIALGARTSQDPDVYTYVDHVTRDLAKEYPDYSLSCTGHSYGDHQCATAVEYMVTREIDVSGVGFNGPGLGDVPNPESYDYVQVDARGDVVSLTGGDQLGSLDITLPVGPHAGEYLVDAAVALVLPPAGAALTALDVLEAHGVSLAREYLEANPKIGNLTAEQARDLGPDQIAALTNDPRGYDQEAASEAGLWGAGHLPDEYLSDNYDSIVRGNPPDYDAIDVSQSYQHTTDYAEGSDWDWVDVRGPVGGDRHASIPDTLVDDFDAEYSYLAVGNEEEIAEYERVVLEGNADTVYAYSGAVNSAWSFYGALEGDNTLAKINAGVGLTRSLERIEGIDFGDDTSATLGNVGYGLGAAMGTIRFFDALEDGNALGAASTGLSTAAQIGQLANISKLSSLGQFAGPVGMFTSFVAGDPIGGVASMLMSTGNPYAVAAGVVLSVFGSSLFGEAEPYEAPAGEGHFFRTDDGDIAFSVSGTAGNQAEHVQLSLNGRFGELDSELSPVPTGDEIVKVALQHTLDTLQDQLPDEFAIIPERLPSLSFNGFFYIASVNDPNTGATQQMAVPRPQVTEMLASVATYSHALVPQWEADTINARLESGDPYYWYTEGQRAHHGLHAELVAPQGGDGDEATDPTPGHPLGEGFTPIVVDLNGDGTATTQAGNQVLFDVDDDGYLEDTNWVAPQDGLLALDRNLDGRIDHASELFANPALGSAYRGLGGLAYLDANQDGMIDETDPVFSSLRIWQDQNSDAVSHPHELISLTQAGITSLAYAANQGAEAEGTAPSPLTTEAGLSAKLLQTTLDATDQGLRLTDLPGGTLVEPEGAGPFFYVTATHTPGSAYSLNPTTVMQEIKAMTVHASRHPFGETSVGLLAVGAGLSAAPAAAGPATTLGASPLAPPVPVRGDPPPPADVADPPTRAASIVTPLAGDDSRLASDNLAVNTPPAGSPAPAPRMAPPETATPTDPAPQAGPPAALPPLSATPVPGAPTPVSQAGHGAFDPVVALTTFAGPDHLSAFEDLDMTIPPGLLLANDNGRGLTIASVDNPIHGTVDFDEYGNIHFDPEGNYYGEARFDYTVKDNTGGLATATATITIHPVNDAPEIDNVAYSPVPITVDKVAIVLAAQTASGSVTTTDVDDALASLTFSMYKHPEHGSASLDPSTGAWSYNSTPCDGYTGPDPFTIRVTDPHGAWGDKEVQVMHWAPDCHDGDDGLLGLGIGGILPLVIDLNGDGISIVGVDDSTVFFDVNDDGYREHIAWAGPEDGLLAYDKDGDGIITDIDEIAFTSYLDGARTDLEGLKGFDTNDDDIFSKLDDKWGEFGIWQDINQDGITDAGEFQSLDHHGITQIDLESDHQHQVYDDGTVLFGTTTYQTEDGTEGLVGDVRLAYDPETVIPAETPLTAAETLAQADNPTQTAAATPGPEDAELNRIVDQLRADMAAFDPASPGALPGEADVDPTADMMNMNQIDDEQEYTQP